MANTPLNTLTFPGLPDTYTIPTKTSDLTNDSGFVTASGAASVAPVQSVNGATGAVTVAVPSASSDSPAMDGTAAVGSSTAYARADHVHPSDTSKADATDVADLKSAINWATPQMYGAVGDGITDDTVSFQRLVANEKKIFVPTGNYLLSNSIALRSDTIIFGDRLNTVIKASPSYSGRGLLSTYLSEANAKNITIKNLTLIGTGSSDLNDFGIEILQNSENINIDNCIIKNTSRDGIRFQRDSSDCTISHCIIDAAGTNIGDGICVYAGCKNVTISECAVKNVASGIGIELEGRTGSTLDDAVLIEANRISECKIINCTADSCADKSYLLINCSNCQIIDCISKNSAKAPFGIIACSKCDIECKSFGDASVLELTPESASSEVGYSENIIINIETYDAGTFGEIKYARDCVVTIKGKTNGIHTTILEDSQNITFTDCDIIATNGVIVRPNHTNIGLILKNSVSRGGACVLRNYGTLTGAVMVGCVDYKTTQETLDTGLTKVGCLYVPA